MNRLLFVVLGLSVSLLFLSTHARAQSSASIEGLVVDQNGVVIPGAEVRLTSKAIAVERVVHTDGHGVYCFAALPVGDYRLEVKAAGFQGQSLEKVGVEVARKITPEFQLHVGNVSMIF